MCTVPNTSSKLDELSSPWPDHMCFLAQLGPYGFGRFCIIDPGSVIGCRVWCNVSCSLVRLSLQSMFQRVCSQATGTQIPYVIIRVAGKRSLTSRSPFLSLARTCPDGCFGLRAQSAHTSCYCQCSTIIEALMVL